MKPMRCVVVDDEPLALELLTSYVRKTPSLSLEGAFSNSVEALTRIQQGDIDLAFLDIQMPDLNGLELARLLPPQTALVFVTAYEQYALEGFKVDAADYLLKPASYADFLTACKKAEKRLTSRPQTPQTPNETLFVKADYKTIPVKLRDIRYIESVKDYVLIHLDPKGESRHPSSRTPHQIMSLQSIQRLIDFLPSPPFLRIHRSYIVNINHIDCIERQRAIFGDEYLPVSDSYREAFEKAVNERTP